MLLTPPVNRWSLASSLMLQAGALLAVLAVPLVWVEVLPPAPIQPPPFIAPRIQAVQVFAAEKIYQAAATVAPLLLQPRRAFVAPSAVPQGTRRIIEAVGPGDVGDVRQPGIPIGGVPFSTGGTLEQTPPPPPPPAPAAKPAEPTSLRVSSGVQAAKLIHQVRPVYPELAKRARIQGVVKLQAVIAKDGTIQQLTVGSGHPLLIGEAMAAVKQWRYQPTYLSGQPVEVFTTIDVHFNLSQ